MPDLLDGVLEKIKRSRENIGNLEAEIAAFFQKSKYPVITDENNKLIPEAVEYHRNLVVPPRFSVLAGEIIHHLRSCFDHVVWAFSDPSVRADRKKSRWIEFPVLKVRPTTKDDITRYERKIEGVTSAGVRDLIERLQPYNSPDPIECPLLIIHEFDLVDKHQELVLVGTTGAIAIPIALLDRMARYQSGEPGSLPINLSRELDGHSQIVPQIAFREFGGRLDEPVAQGLMMLHNFTTQRMKEFDGFL